MHAPLLPQAYVRRRVRCDASRYVLHAEGYVVASDDPAVRVGDVVLRVDGAPYESHPPAQGVVLLDVLRPSRGDHLRRMAWRVRARLRDWRASRSR